MRRIILTMAAMIVFLGGSYSQQSREKGSPTPCSYSELYRKDGWMVPGLKGAKIKVKRMAVEDSPGMSMMVLEPTEPEPTITVFRCSRDHVGRMEIDEIPIGIITLWAFDFGGRTFAYRLSYGIDTIENGQRMPTGSAANVMFYDLDGSGRFVLRKSAGGPSDSVAPAPIPEWVTKE
jgi:hypothetical protein